MSKDNTGALFTNDKGDNPSRPDYRGDVTIGGVKYALAAWSKEGRNGPYLSLSVSEWKEKPKAEGQGGRPPAGDLDDRIPFAPER
jgi:hypothetical protein